MTHATCHEEINTNLWQNRAYPLQTKVPERIEMPTLYYNNVTVLYPALTARNTEMTTNIACATTGGLQY